MICSFVITTGLFIVILIVTYNIHWSEFVETNATFLSASTADRNVAFVTTNSLQSKLKIPVNLIIGAMKNIFHIIIILFRCCREKEGVGEAGEETRGLLTEHLGNINWASHNASLLSHMMETVELHHGLWWGGGVD